MARRFIVLLVIAMGSVFAVPAAQADTGDIIEPQHEPPTAADGFQAGTCTTDTPECTPATTEAFYKQAGGHPPIGFTQYIVKTEELEAGKIVPIGAVNTIRVDLPAGLTVNPQATGTQCTMEQFLERTAPIEGELPKCPPTSLTGEELATVIVSAGGTKGTI